MRFHIAPAHDGTTARLLLRGEFDLPAYGALRAAIVNALADPGVDELVIDLTDTTFLDCGAVGVIVAGRNLAAARPSRYELVGARDEPLNLLRLLGFAPDGATRSSTVVER